MMRVTARRRLAPDGLGVALALAAALAALAALARAAGLAIDLAPLRLLMGKVHHMANMRRAADDLERLGEATENGSKRQEVECGADTVMVA